jgi:hypothetical protein
VLHAAPAEGGGCELWWGEHLATVPNQIKLDNAPPDCVEDAGHLTTVRGTMHGNVPAVLRLEGPQGEDRFFNLELLLGGPAPASAHRACAIGTTVGWRLLADVADHALAPLPWLSDVDGDGSAELVVWDRLAWGDSMIESALLPIVYVLDGDVLVRRDDRAKKLFARVAATYRLRAQNAKQGDPTACFLAVAAFLAS